MDTDTFRPLFTGDSLTGWRACSRSLYYKDDPALYAESLHHTGLWTIENGVLEGRQSPPGSGFGAYLISEESFGDFELMYEAKPDWPADTGVYLRASDDGCVGYQVLLDHRKSGSIGGYFGNGIGSFHAINWNVDADLGANGELLRVKLDDPATTLEPLTPDKPALLEYAITGEEFLRIWKSNDWNEFRVVCVGALPHLTAYINGVKVTSINMATLQTPKFLREKALAECARGHIALEVHDNDPAMGAARWGKDAACRWRNMRIRTLG